MLRLGEPDIAIKYCFSYCTVFGAGWLLVRAPNTKVTRPDPDTLPGFPGWSRLVKSHRTIHKEYPMELHFKKESKHIH